MAEARRRELNESIDSSAAALSPLDSSLRSHCQYLQGMVPQLQREHGRFERLWEQLGLLAATRERRAPLQALLAASPQAHDARFASAPLTITTPLSSVCLL